MGVYGYCVNIITLMFGILFLLFTCLVILEFFKLTHHNGLLSRALRLVVIISAIEFLIAFICFFEPQLIRTFGLIVVYTGICALSIWILLLFNFYKFSADKIYQYIFLAYTCIFFAHTYQIMILLGIFQIHSLSIYSVSVGSMLEMLFLAKGISLYIQQMQEEAKINQQLLDFQMRFASIGRVIGNISHQWKMPMIRAGSLLTHIEALIHFKNEKALSEIEQTIPQIRSHFIFMQNTIDEFYSLYSKNTNKSQFKLLNVINDVWGMLSTKVSSCEMKLFIKDLQDTQMESFEYSFSHIVIILIDNSLDAMKARHIRNPYMNIDISHDNGIVQIIFEDNCGGIEQEPIESIFDGITSSKSSAISTGGLGLSIVKLLVNEKFAGTISVNNTRDGARFVLHLPIIHEK